MGEQPKGPETPSIKSKKSFSSTFTRKQKSESNKSVKDNSPSVPNNWSTGFDKDDFQSAAKEISSNSKKEGPQRTPSKILMGLVIFLILIAGFWVRPVVSALGIPVSSTPYSALYFEDPHLATVGIKPGSLVAFGINNGATTTRTFKWEAKVETRLLKSGTIKLGPHQRATVKIKVTGGQPMDFFRVSVNTLSSPIVAVVTA